METLANTATKPFSLENLKKVLSQHWQIEDSPEHTVVVHGPGSRAYLSLDPEFNGPDKFCLQIDYSDVELVKDIVKRIADDPTLIVDNDFGTAIPGNEFVARCKAESGWDWRRSR